MGFVGDILIPKINGALGRETPPVVPVVPLRGVIGNLGAMRQGLTLESVAPQLEKAFALKRADSVALAVNSPGGSPVQSALIARRIRQLADENDKRVIAFCEDVAASGGYWLATAADEIYADENSIVGSIGVISSSFGFTDAIKKLGIERRLHTAGENKSFMDPFLPEREKDVERLKGVQGDMHDSFKDHVNQRRAGKLADDPEVFSGAFWTGARAKELGLIDGLGDLRGTLRQRYGDKVKLPVLKRRQGWFQRRFGGSGAGLPMGELWADNLLAAVEERLIWDRFRF